MAAAIAVAITIVVGITIAVLIRSVMGTARRLAKEAETVVVIGAVTATEIRTVTRTATRTRIGGEPAIETRTRIETEIRTKIRTTGAIEIATKTETDIVRTIRSTTIVITSTTTPRFTTRGTMAVTAMASTLMIRDTRTGYSPEPMTPGAAKRLSRSVRTSIPAPRTGTTRPSGIRTSLSRPIATAFCVATKKATGTGKSISVAGGFVAGRRFAPSVNRECRESKARGIFVCLCGAQTSVCDLM